MDGMKDGRHGWHRMAWSRDRNGMEVTEWRGVEGRDGMEMAQTAWTAWTGYVVDNRDGTDDMEGGMDGMEV